MTTDPSERGYSPVRDVPATLEEAVLWTWDQQAGPEPATKEYDLAALASETEAVDDLR